MQISGAASGLGPRQHEVDSIFAETKRRFDRLDQPRPILLRDRNAVLNDLHARAQAFNLCLGISPDDFSVHPNSQISLLLEELKENMRLCFRGYADPESYEDRAISFRDRRIPRRCL